MRGNRKSGQVRIEGAGNKLAAYRVRPDVSPMYGWAGVMRVVACAPDGRYIRKGTDVL
jgi:hypothetical protein